MLKIGIIGLSGKMGQEIFNVLQKHPQAVFSEGCSSKAGTIENVFKNSNIVIDFSSPRGFFEAAKIAKKTSIPLVSGTTGFSIQDEEEIKKISKDIVLVMSSNMSFGVNMLFKLAKDLSAKLKNKPEYDIEILETHHINKKDSPSGTAITLGKKIAEGRDADFYKVAQYGRNLQTHQKKQGEIGFSSIRSGGIIGEHAAIFGSIDDRIELSHKAFNRTIFAKGAVDLAIMVHKSYQKGLSNGLYEYLDFFEI